MFLVSSTTAVGIRDGGGDNGDGRVQLADNLKIFKTDNFDLDVYVQSKCQSMNEKHYHYDVYACVRTGDPKVLHR